MDCYTSILLLICLIKTSSSVSQPLLSHVSNTDVRCSSGYPRQRWIPGWDYDEKGEVIMDSRVNHREEDLSQLPVDWYVEKSEEP